MIKKIRKIIQENQMLEAGDRVLVGLSGGADSVCLLSILLSLKSEYCFSVAAVHINHQLRDAEAERDAEFCKALCNRYQIQLHTVRLPIAKIAAENKQSIETAAREARYSAFNKIADEYGYTKIAVAHNANDQAETILMHMLRGSGIEGLRGILPIREKIIRPLLTVSREEIERYNREKALDYVFDSTNADTVYLRNHVRHRLLSLICDEYNPNFVQTISQTAYLLQKDAEFLSAQAKLFEEEHLYCDGTALVLNTETYASLDEAVALRVIKNVIAECVGKKQDIPFDTVLRCDALCKDAQSGKSVDLPMGYCAKREQSNCIAFCKKASLDAYCDIVPEGLPYSFESPCGMVRLELVTSVRRDVNDCVYFDYDKLAGALSFRNRRAGDAICLRGMDGSKKLKDYFIDEKIPKHLRDVWPLLCCGDTILWICGKRKCVGYDVNAQSQKILRCTFKGDLK